MKYHELLKALLCSYIIICNLSSCSLNEISLQWNPLWRTDTPYELTFEPEKIGGTDWVAKADDTLLHTEYFFDNYEYIDADLTDEELQEIDDFINKHIEQ